jgi:hypothetical protein
LTSSTEFLNKGRNIASHCGRLARNVFALKGIFIFFLRRVGLTLDQGSDARRERLALDIFFLFTSCASSTTRAGGAFSLYL